MRQKEEMPPFNNNSSGISLLLSPLAIYLCHSMGEKKKKKISPAPSPFLNIGALCNITPCWHLYLNNP